MTAGAPDQPAPGHPTPDRPRLSAATLAAATRSGALPRPGVTGPPPGDLGRQIGVLHLGIGAFHRAHQAVYTEDAAVAGGEAGWGICGVTMRSPAVVDQLRPQDGRYGVLERGTSATRLRIVGQVGEVLDAGRDAHLLTARFSDPAVRVISLTVTEKGYLRTGRGRLDLPAAPVRADLAGGAARTVVGRLVRGLQRRAATSDAPVTVLSCDNLTGNGRTLQALVADFCATLPSPEGEPLADWIGRQVTFPNTVVDRIVPATTEQDRHRATDLLGLVDAGLVVTEPFRQWVIEDRFAADRPRWELAGAELVTDVEPYQQLKLRMLNGAHSALAYLGALAGYATIAQTVADPELADTAERLLREDVAPTLDAPPGVDLDRYGRTVLDRFANPALRHRTTQIAMDGSQKLPLRLLGTIADALAAGRTPRWAIRAVAAWMAYVAVGRSRTGVPLPLDDPLADRLRGAVSTAEGPRAIVDALLGLPEVFEEDLARQPVLRDCLIEELAALLTRPARPAVARVPLDTPGGGSAGRAEESDTR